MHSLVCCHTTLPLGKGEAKYIALTCVKPPSTAGFYSCLLFWDKWRSNFGLLEKQITVTVGASQKSGAQLPKK